MNVEHRVGIRGYITSTGGIGGLIKEEPDYFKVTEVADVAIGEGKHLILRVAKRNWDTINFARVLSNKLGISQKRIGYAGTKDKRAFTVQYYSIANAREVAEKLEGLHIKDAEIEVIGWSNRALKLGDLIGNEFEIRITESDADSEIIDETIEELKVKGSPNFFGTQRFGTIRYITHIVGLHILKRDYGAAFWTYVAKPFVSENEEVRKIREELWESRDPKFGLRELPKHLRYERTLLQKLIEENSEEKALLSLPKNLKMMFVHAYQSYVFNRILSDRIAEFKTLREICDEDIVDFIRIRNGRLTIAGNPVEVRNRKRIDFLISVGRAVLCLPLPGYKTEVKGWVKDRLLDILAEDDISFEDFRHEHKEFSSSGEFRSAEIPIDFDELYYEIDGRDVFMKFFLPKGCYATSFLREFQKS
ncbi:tRNA pseudouridine synthase, TruD family [Archaeoglobus sulfaticallidus PM70-1]|uniref:Probable tRNA pseudouridine synthase D n=1 Tax=Archaeoglobus sulfaticallidus PM70-1 TaxID=387631 RepID=N0BJE0_9EURY|nr:tRNA pseudouridine(13) synthase TruD [Archaeoglobus sulfaticallidus]AGK60275.1 tRNA pseudouridine synthase, TruD family [Archaeoglobus sulfaticallidus PM70-1]